MTLSTIITMLVGLGLPALIALVTKEALPDHLKVLILLALSTASGVVSSLAGSVPSTLSGWGHIALNILMTFLAGAAADVAAWKPSGALHAIAARTADFGIGPSPGGGTVAAGPGSAGP